MTAGPAAPAAGKAAPEGAAGRVLSALAGGARPWASHALMAPASLWLFFFLVLPVALVLAVSFTRRGPYGILTWDLTVANYGRALSAVYLPVLLRSLAYAGAATAAAMVLGYPVAYALSYFAGRWRGLLIILLMLPFWNSCLVAIYSWMIILGREGLLNHALLRCGLLSEPIELINTPFAVVLGLSYFYLPFMILPLYATLEKIPRSYIEAAKDLGAGRVAAFLKVTLPLSLPGVAAGCILTFVPCVGDFLTAEFLGGTQTLMIGNLINIQYHQGQDWPFGGALAAVLVLILLCGMAVYLRVEPEGAEGGRA